MVRSVADSVTLATPVHGAGAVSLRARLAPGSAGPAEAAGESLEGAPDTHRAFPWPFAWALDAFAFTNTDARL